MGEKLSNKEIKLLFFPSQIKVITLLEREEYYFGSGCEYEKISAIIFHHLV